MARIKTIKTLYWATTGFIVLFEGVMPALTSHTDLAVEGIRHLGYPDYFRVMLTFFKVTGALVLFLPFIKGNPKEWAYAGFGITMISAFVSHSVIDGFGYQTLLPAITFVILVSSYISYHKLLALNQFAKSNPNVISIYKNDIRSKTGESPADSIELAGQKGFRGPDRQKQE